MPSSATTVAKKGRKCKKQNEKEIMKEYFTHAVNDLPEPAVVVTGTEKFTLPKNMHQEKLVAVLKDPTKKIVFITGPAGTGKTLFATEMGLYHYWKAGEIQKLVFTRPNIAVDEELGFLPGTMEEKLGPYVRPIYDILYQFLTPPSIVHMMEDKTMEIAPLGFMRGRTFKNTWIVADEMQNATISQMKMLLTRIGENSKLIITGDLDQSDIGRENGLKDFLEKWKCPSKHLAHIQFQTSDILREVVVQEILDIYNGL
jgi:phosphate starvation-inducible PhoH-like protein